MPKGMVSLVGAGPGDPELITVRGLTRLRAAEVLVYDRLVHPALIAEAQAGCERIYAGKSPGKTTLDQRAIEDLLIDRGRRGLRVVRLKGGDPFVFGRGGEELAALVEAGIPVEVVPGVTSAIAAPAAAGIPVTHRHLASAVTFVTAHEDPAKITASVDWEWLARSSGTLVILMGLRQVDAICARLLAAGRPSDTPAAVIASGTLPTQRVVRANLGELACAVAQAALESPALIVVGEVVRFAELFDRSSSDPFSSILASQFVCD
ncbi:MAG TPA: uroporphyrinogen-III C-methyltransferase [Nitrolancea sp.]|nr:uroporphyrinogen-III C-methyltransferase [Nitrolancea sp.]